MNSEEFFKNKINDLGIILKTDFDPTPEGKTWHVYLKNGDSIIFEWASLYVSDPIFTDLWFEYDKEKGGVIFDLTNSQGQSKHIVLIPNEDIIKVD